MKTITLLATSLLILNSAQAQTVTYSEHIAPIIYNHCTSCHRSGEIAPFSLTNYSEVQSWSTLIEYVTDIGYMPPWKAEINYQRYQNENYLTPQQVQLIRDWVAQGTPQGNPALEPPLPVFPTGSQIGTPDHVVSFAESYKHVGNNMDEYRYFVLPTGLTQDVDLVGLEVRPGNKSIVHHTLVWQDTTGQAAADDAATPEYGYESGTGSAFNGINDQLPGYVPGQKPLLYTNGIGMKLYAGSDLKLQMHYAPTTADEWDSTSINLFFAQQPLTRYVKSYVMLPFPTILTNGPFIIYANTVKEFHGRWTVPSDISMIGIAPHMHKLGQHWKIYAIKPSGDTIPLININEWDFNWQGSYSFQRMHPLPAGTVIHAYAEYDNTVNNIHNPNNPPQLITWGENTSDEMYYLPLIYLDYMPGDENIIFPNPTSIDESPYYMVKNKLYPISPNPASKSVKIGFTLAEGSNVSMKIADISGKIVKTILNNRFCLPGLHTHDADISSLSSGVYNVIWDNNEKRQVQKVVVKN